VILDSSAIIAIILDEPERAALLAKMDTARVVAVAAPTLAEAGIVLCARTGDTAHGGLHAFMTAADAVVIDFGSDHWQVALDAWERFGRGRHPAGLNLGDCLAYAAARVAGLPLLAKGDGFPLTDVELA
jgi:ribonuclease VapC